MIDVEESLIATVAKTFLDAIDWSHPTWQGAPLDPAARTPAAACAAIRRLRERPSPCGWERPFVDRLRASASAATRAAARAELDQRLCMGMYTATSGDGRASVLGAIPTTLLVAATAADFDQTATRVYRDQPNWGTSAHHSIMHLHNTITAMWRTPECCSDAAMLPLLTFLIVQSRKEWNSARRWNEASLGTQGHNWWVAEYTTFASLGLFLPELENFAQFRAFLPTFFEREIRLLHKDDGFSREASFAYHVGTADLWLNMVRFAAVYGIGFSELFCERLRLMFEVEWKMMTPDGGHPPFGDCWFRGPYLLDRARSVAALLGIPEAKYLAETLKPVRDDRFGDCLVESLHYPSVGEDLVPAYAALTARAPAALDAALASSGYFAMRSSWGRDADYLAIEASERGNLVTSHGHGAMFDMHLFSRGRAILVGNGKGPCGSPEPERSWRVGCASHNVATVDELDHLPLRSVYRFGQVLLPTVECWQTGADHAYFSGVHEAYERLERKVTGSRRKVYYRRGAYWVLIDRFTANGATDSHRYTQHFQLATGARLLPGRRVVTTGEGGNLLFVPVLPYAADPAATAGAGAGAATAATSDLALPTPTLSPCPYPLDPAEFANPLQLRYSRRQLGSAILPLLMVPFVGDTPPEVRVTSLPIEADRRLLDGHEATALDIRIGDRHELYVDLHTAWNLPWRCAGHASTERLYVAPLD